MENRDGDSSASPTSAAEAEKTVKQESPVSREPLSSPQKTLSELRFEALEGEKVGARKLTFAEQCGAFSALYAGVRNMVVARAFGISLQCASKISGCLEYDPDPYRYEYAKGQNADLELPAKVMRDHNRNRRSLKRHHYYQTVAREFEALGREEFDRRYYTERVLNRIIVAKAELRGEAHAKKTRK